MKDMNYLALRGQTTTDQEFIEQFNLDPALAGTPEINDAMLDIVYDINYAHYMDANGMTEEDAHDKANTIRENTRHDIKRLLKK